MGVQGLWELLAPVGRRVSVETLAGRKLAIDASIWIIQFMKAMRDEKGEMVKNAHILGFFRRICKLLFLRAKPVFVFDGGTPALKRRTVIARRRQRENAQAKIRKTAEKLLLNHLKRQKLEELAIEIKNKKQKDGSKGKHVIFDKADLKENSSQETGFERTKVVTDTYDQKTLDELLAASLAAEEENFTGNASTSAGDAPFEEEDMMDDSEEMIFPEMQGKVDPAVLAALPPSMQLDLLVQMRERLMAENRQKYQKVKKAPTKFSELQIQSYLKTVAFRREIVEVQKSAAGRGVSGVPVSRIASEANREFIFSSSFTGDKQVLATAGVEKNGETEPQTHEMHPTSSDSVNCNPSTVPFFSVTEADIVDSELDSDHPVETYLDERGRVRVSRVRGMGIRMTRDLQWNLNMMNELEQQKRVENIHSNEDIIFRDVSLGVAKDLHDNSCLMEASNAKEGNDEIIISLDKRNGKLAQDSENRDLNEESSVRRRSTIEISFLDDETDHNSRDDDDDLFTSLVAGSSASGFFSESGRAQGMLLRKCQNEIRDSDMREERQLAFIEGSHTSDDSEVDWEDGVCDIPVNPSPSLNENKISVSRGSLLEEADIQEAIRRSLEDQASEKSACLSSAKKKIEVPGERASEEKMTRSPLQIPSLAKKGNGPPNMLLEDDLPHQMPVEAMAETELIHNMGGSDGLNNDNDSWNKLSAPTTTREHKTDVKFMVIDEFENYQASKVELLNQAIIADGNACLGPLDTDRDTPLESTKGCTVSEVEFSDTSNQMEMESSLIVTTKMSPEDSSCIPTEVEGGLPVVVVDADFHNSQASVSHHHSETIKCSPSLQEGSFPKVDPSDIAREQELCDLLADEEEHYRELKKIEDTLESQEVVDAVADLGEEMLLLRQEQVDLRDEQRKLERNAESVSSEMFAECQELLQMFGLPYIIAPMEAEAQCAYLELKGLVDGIVTDDSDVFLFGGQSVYKNIFDDRKYVETYFLKDIESELGLTREKLIRMALLLGSDYTEGVSGIGIVNAIEVVHAFPEEDGLRKFREWIESPDPSILEKVDAHSGKSSRKRFSKDGNSHGAGSINMVGVPDDQQCTNNIPNLKQIFMEKHRNVSKNWHIPSSFPSEAVVSAYASAQVDDSTEPFSWGKPDLFVLRKLCWERFGWSKQKADELLQPVLKEYNRHETQLRLEAFYSFNERFAKIRSRRIQKAVKGITGKRSAELMVDVQKETSISKKRRESPSPEEDESAVGNQRDVSEKPASKQPKRKTKTQSSQSERNQPEMLIQGEGSGKKESRGSMRGRGRGRGRGRVRGRGGRILVPEFKESETSSSDFDDDNNEKVEQVQMKITEPSELRRSTRPKRRVSYMVEDAEADGISDLANQSNGNRVDAEVVERDSFADNQSDNPSNEDGAFPGDYLFSGGGFCADEADQSNVPVVGFPCPAEASAGLFVDGNFDLDASEANNSVDNKIFSGSDRILQTQMIYESDRVTESESDMGLRAMPSLRRRKKS